MPFGDVKLIPGVNTEKTPVLNEAGYSQSAFGRFKDGLFQKLGGWQKFYPFAVSGVPREIHPWQDLNAVQHLGVGTTSQLAVITAGNLLGLTPQTFLSDFAPNFSTTSASPIVTITDANVTNLTVYDAVYFNTPVSVGGLILSGLYPIAVVTGAHSYQIAATANATSTVTSGGAVPAFTTTSGSSSVSVALAGHGLAVGNSINFPIATTGSGVTIQGTYTVVTVPDSSHITITANTLATGSTTFSMNSGNAELLYYITLGPVAAGTGYGLGGYGLGGYGSGTAPGSQTGTPITATDWSLDNFGDFMVACPKNGGIYVWDPTGGFTTAQFIATAPPFNAGAFVAMPEQQIIAWGTTTPINMGVEQDPLLVKYCDIGDFTDWVGTSDNQAGTYRLSSGSMIVGGMQAAQQNLLWTDLDLWSVSYIGAPLVYSFNIISSGCGLIGQHAACQLRGSVYWMGKSNFFVLSGSGVQVLPCSVWDVVFQNLNTQYDPAFQGLNSAKSRAAANTPFNEVWFFYPSASGSGENDSYVKVNVLDGTWDYGSLARSAWTDQSVLGAPIGASPQSVIYQHETTNDADGAPLVPVMQTGYWKTSDGETLTFVDWFLPDFRWGFFGAPQTAQISVTLYGIDYPGDTPVTYGPYLVTQQVPYFSPRIRKRFISMSVTSNDLGTWWRLGGARYRFSPDGRR